MDEVTQKALDAAFPYGVEVAQEGDAPNRYLVNLQVGEDNGKVAILGWAYPNKDMIYYPEDVMVREDGDWIFHSGGTRYRFGPLTKEQGKKQKNMMAEV